LARRISAIVLFIGIWLWAAGAVRAQVVISGQVTDNLKQPLAGAQSRVESSNATTLFELTTNSDGSFHLNLDAAGQYFLTIAAPGYFTLTHKPIDLTMGVNIITVEMLPQQTSQTSLEVYADQNLIVDHIPVSYALTNEEILAIPVSRAYYWQNTIASMPGVLKDSRGRLHFNGSSSDQNNWLMDGFNIADPSSGQLEADFNSEAINSFDLFTGRYSAEYGKGSGGTLVINNETGSPSFKYHATNFIPGLAFDRNGLRLDTWRPRLDFSGPLKKDRLWFSDSISFNYKLNYYPELPPGQDTAYTWNASNIFRLQAMLTPNQNLSGEILINRAVSPNDGLSVLDPLETTLNRKNDRYFFNLRDQISFHSRAILELGYGGYRSNNQETPQGKQLYIITPLGREGNSSLDAHWWGDRDQWMARLSLPSFQGWGSHQIKLGADFNYIRYRQETARTGYEFQRVDGTRSAQVMYGGNGSLALTNFEAASYFEDQWAIRSWLVLVAAARWDRDQVIGKNSFTPWSNLGFQLPGLKSTRFMAGIGLVPASTNMELFTRDLDQYPVFTQFGSDGNSIVRGPQSIHFLIDRPNLSVPRTANISAGIQQNLWTAITLRLNYLHKQSGNGFSFVSAVPSFLSPYGTLSAGAVDSFYRMENKRQEKYDSLEISLQGPARTRVHWYVSYTLSRACSNAALDLTSDHPAAMVMEPLPIYGTPGRLSWDSPNRLIGWMIMPIKKKNTLSGLIEWRDGFPFSIYDEAGLLAGPVNTNRLPRYFSVNVHFERRFHLIHYQWAVRLGVDNLTNSVNASFVNNMIGSPQFLYFYGREPRKWVLRLRWLGKKPV
jgi:hypothetical protein